MSDPSTDRSIRDQAWREGYEFGRKETVHLLSNRGIAGAPITHTEKFIGDNEAFWAYHLRRVEEGHYE